MSVHLVNPSHLSFGVGVITPRWLFVLAGATPMSYGQPCITDETLEAFEICTDLAMAERQRNAPRAAAGRCAPSVLS